MILFFGPAGAGKSLQGQLLSVRHGWKWLSTGKLLRESDNPEVIRHIGEGNLVSDELMYQVLDDALSDSKNAENFIFDGFPRTIEQAKWLMGHQKEHEYSIDVAIVFEVPRQELVNRLGARGRSDDTPEAIDVRLGIYRKEIYPILDFLNDKNVPIVHLGGVGTVGQVHDAINDELTNRGLTNKGQ